MTCMSEKELAERDKRIENLIRIAIKDYEDQLWEYEYLVRQTKRNVERIKDAISREAWNELDGLLNREDIVSLYCVSPLIFLDG